MKMKVRSLSVVKYAGGPQVPPALLFKTMIRISVVSFLHGSSLREK